MQFLCNFDMKLNPEMMQYVRDNLKILRGPVCLEVMQSNSSVLIFLVTQYCSLQAVDAPQMTGLSVYTRGYREIDIIQFLCCYVTIQLRKNSFIDVDISAAISQDNYINLHYIAFKTQSCSKKKKKSCRLITL